MSYRAVNSRSSLGVARKDAGKGRCRLTTEQFKALSLQIGWVVRIRLVFPNRQCDTDILCTSWPDSSNNVADENLIYVDDSVQFDYGGDMIEFDWIECDCQVHIVSGIFDRSNLWLKPSSVSTLFSQSVTFFRVDYCYLSIHNLYLFPCSLTPRIKREC